MAPEPRGREESTTAFAGNDGSRHRPLTPVINGIERRALYPTYGYGRGVPRREYPPNPIHYQNARISGFDATPMSATFIPSATTFFKEAIRPYVDRNIRKNHDAGPSKARVRSVPSRVDCTLRYGDSYWKTPPVKGNVSYAELRAIRFCNEQLPIPGMF